MVSLNRNHNLEEINSDGFLGIDMMKNQTIGQKIVLFGAVGIGKGIHGHNIISFLNYFLKADEQFYDKSILL